MKLLVGVLYSGENEYQQCMESIHHQTVQSFDIFQIENQANKTAHDLLYQRFMDSASDYDLFVKVDADMVLARKDLFALIIKKFQLNSQMKDLEIAVHDYFCDQLIWGMHVFRHDMRWKQGEDQLIVDSVYAERFEPGEHVRDDQELAPAAYHCPDPSDFQAFHYGVHKALKIIQPDRNKARLAWSDYHFSLIQKMERHYIETGKDLVGLAVLGAHVTLKNKTDVTKINYTNKTLINDFKEYEDLKGFELANKIKYLKRKNFSFLPGNLQKKILIYCSRPGSRFKRLHQSI